MFSFLYLGKMSRGDNGSSCEPSLSIDVGRDLATYQMCVHSEISVALISAHDVIVVSLGGPCLLVGGECKENLLC